MKIPRETKNDVRYLKEGHGNTGTPLGDRGRAQVDSLLGVHSSGYGAGPDLYVAHVEVHTPWVLTSRG